MATPGIQVNPGNIRSARLKHIYDLYRTARMNELYYQHSIKRLKGTIRFFDIVIAVGASTTIGGLAIFKSGWGASAWNIAGGLTALLAVLKPVLQLGSNLESKTKLHADYRILVIDMKLLVDEITVRHTLDSDLEKKYDDAVSLWKRLRLQDVTSFSRGLREKCYQDVNQEIPSTGLWMPEGA